MILKSLSTAGNNKIHPPKFLNSAGYTFILVSLQGRAYAQLLACTCTEQTSWHVKDEVRRWISDFLVFVLQQHEQTPPQCNCRGQTCHSTHTHGQIDTHAPGHQPQAASHIKANFRLLHYWGSPSGRRGLVSRVDVHLTSTLAAASLTSAGRSSLQHEHTNAPHWAKQATALKL